jgi:cytochrome c biogenesis protein CcdA
VIDPAGAALRAVTGGSGWAYPLLFAAGLFGSIGPCVAPRYVAVAALVANARRPFAVTALFVLGVVAAYVALGTVAGAIGTLLVWSTALYTSLSAVLIVAGVVTLVRAAPHRHGHDAAKVPVTAGGTFLLGAATALVVSPCCTPLLAAIAGLTILGGRAAAGASLLAAFAIGHTTPLLIAATGARLPLLRRLGTSAVPAIVAGTLLIALGGYYGALA